MTASRTLSILLLALALPALRPAPLAAQSLRGSEESVDAAYDRARQRGLAFYRTASQVRAAARDGDFVRLAGNADYSVKKMSFPYVLSSTRTFVEGLASEYREVCHERLVVTSGVRPTTRQPRNSVSKSVHPTGMAVDLRKPRGVVCREWLRDRLLELEARGFIDATEEFHPPHFHVAVYSAAGYLAHLSASAADH